MILELFSNHNNSMILWSTFASILILFLQLPTHPQPQLVFVQLPYECPTPLAQGSSRAALPCQVDRCSHKPKADNHRSFSANYLLHSCETKAITKPKETHSPWQPKTKYPAETRYDHPCLSVQVRKCDTKKTDICYIVHCTMCWEEMKMCLKKEEQNSSINSQEQASTETHPCQKLAFRIHKQ